MKMVKMKLEEFEKMVREIKTLKAEVKKLQNANDFLNNQIEEYNQFQREQEERLNPKEK